MKHTPNHPKESIICPITDEPHTKCHTSLVIEKSTSRTTKSHPNIVKLIRNISTMTDTSYELQLFYPDITWPDINILSNALADYIAIDILDHESARNRIFYIVNEILEHAVKYGNTSIAPISIRVSHQADMLTIKATNKAHKKQATTLGHQIIVLNGDHVFADLMLERVKQSYKNYDDTSHLGLSSILLFGGNLDCDISYDLDNHEQATTTIKLTIGKKNLIS